MVIDAHTHNFKLKDKFYTADDLIASMDEAGIDYSMLIANSSVEDGLVTEQVIDVSKKYPRIKAVGSVHYPTLDKDKIDKLIDYLKEKKIHAVKLYPGYEDFYPLDEKLFGLYEKCQRLGKPVIFHTGVLMIGSTGLLKQIHPLNIDEVAQKFPDLPIIMAHFGNPWIIDAAAVVAKNKNVFVDLSGYFTEYESISKEESGSFIKQLTEFKSFVGNFKKCLFGTDYPLYSQKEYLEVVSSLPFEGEEKDLVLWKNAKDIFDFEI